MVLIKYAEWPLELEQNDGIWPRARELYIVLGRKGEPRVGEYDEVSQLDGPSGRREEGEPVTVVRAWCVRQRAAVCMI